MEKWKKGRFERTIKELSQFDDKRSEELESEFDHFDAANSYPTSPFKGHNIMDLDFDADNSYPTSPFKGRNIVNLDFVYKQLRDWHKACKTTLSCTQYKRERLMGLTSILYLSLQNCSTVTVVKRSIYDVNTK